MTPLERQLDRLERRVLKQYGLDVTDPPSQIRVMVAASWNEALHPRGRDGKFIDKGGFVKGIFNWLKDAGDSTNPMGKGTSKKADRVKIVGFSSGQGGSTSDPWVKVEYDGPDPDLKGKVGFAKASEVSEAVSVKARIDADPVDAPDAPDAPDVDAPDIDSLRSRVHGDDVDLAPDIDAPDSIDAPDTGEAEIELDEPGIPDEAPSAPDPKGDADQIRQFLEDEIATKGLDPEDASARAGQLDAIFGQLGFGTALDTDALHNKLGPAQDIWTEERQALHKEMWDELLGQIEAADIPKDRDALALGGLPGAGKSSTLKPGGAASEFGVVTWEPPGPIPEGATHVSINPDLIKEMLIEKQMLPDGVPDQIKPMEQVHFIHEESSTLSKDFVRKLSELGYNIVLDNTMETPNGMLKRMRPLAEEGYTFRGLFVDIPVGESRESARKRYERGMKTELGGRFVPSGVQRDEPSKHGRMSPNRDAFDELAGVTPEGQVTGMGWFTDFIVVDNTGVSSRNPRAEVTLRGGGDGSPAAALYNTINDQMEEIDPTVAE